MGDVTPLRIVHGETGEQLGEDCPHCHETDLANRTLRSQLTKAKNENARLMGLEPDAKDIMAVLEYWRERCMPKAGVVVGSDRWKAVRDRLRDTDAISGEPVFNPLKLRAAVVGALLDPWMAGTDPRKMRENGGKVVRHLDATTIFKSTASVERHIGRAITFKRQTGTSALAIVDELAGEGLLWLAERCGCGHLRLDHVRQGPTPDGRQPCDRCGCGDMDYLAARVNRTLAEFDALEPAEREARARELGLLPGEVPS